MSPILNSLTTLFLEQNFIKNYEKDFVRMDFKTNRNNEHFELKANVEYADRRALQNLENTNPYRWIDWKKRSFTPNDPMNEERRMVISDPEPPTMEPHQALTVGVSAFYKPWQTYKIKGGTTAYYDDD